jgi:hypothetical protein
MSRTSRTVYDAVHQEAYNMVRDIVEGIKADDSITTEDELYDAVHQACDDALIYTVDQYTCLWGLPDADDAIEEGMVEPKTVQGVVAAQAYLNIAQAVNEHHEEFMDIIAQRADRENDARIDAVIADGGPNDAVRDE